MTDEKKGTDVVGSGVFDTGVGAALDALVHEDDAVEIVESVGAISVIGAQERAEIDMQIATAKRYPRSISRFVKQARSLALATPQIAAQCSYALPRGGKTIVGPSIRLAEIVAPSWGNCRYGSRVTDIGERFVTVQGLFYDLENNVAVTVDVKRRITDKNKNRYNDDMIQQTCQAAGSIGVRNAIFRGIPGGIVEAIRLEAEDVALGKKDGLATQVGKALAYFKDEHKITAKKIYKTLLVESEKDITWGHVSRLIGFRTSIESGESTADLIFADNPGVVGQAPPTEGRKTRKPRKTAAEKKAEAEAKAEEERRTAEAAEKDDGREEGADTATPEVEEANTKEIDPEADEVDDPEDDGLGLDL